MTEKYLVLGSNSFSGASFIANLLLNDENVLIKGISRSPEPGDVFLPYKNVSGFSQRFSFHQLNINADLDKVISLIKKFKPNYIINFAAQGMVAQSWENPIHWYNTNVISLLELIDSIYNFDFIDMFVQASTPEVYGPCNDSRESMCFFPSSPYAASKASADTLLHAYHATRGFPVCFTRSANVFGPYQQLYRIIPRAVFTIKKNEKIPLHGGGAAIRSFIHINDVSSATIKLAKSGTSGEVYHLSDTRTIKIYDLVSMIAKLMNKNIEECSYNISDRVGQDSKYLMNAEKMMNSFSWKPEISLKQGILEVIEWVDRNFDYMNTLPLDYIHKE